MGSLTNSAFYELSVQCTKNMLRYVSSSNVITYAAGLGWLPKDNKRNGCDFFGILKKSMKRTCLRLFVFYVWVNELRILSLKWLEINCLIYFLLRKAFILSVSKYYKYLSYECCSMKSTKELCYLLLSFNSILSHFPIPFSNNSHIITPISLLGPNNEFILRAHRPIWVTASSLCLVKN